MRKTLLLCGIHTRAEAIGKLLASVKEHKRFADWEFCLVYQGPVHPIDNLDRVSNLIQVPDLIGAHSARILGLRSQRSDIWANLDDDMLFLKTTNFSPMVRVLQENPAIGFISGGWVKSAAMLGKKKITNEWIRQHVVYTGGGLLYREDVADMMREHPDQPYLLDDVEWSMTAYVNGYDNYRYKGSVLEHKVCKADGRRMWVRLSHKTLPNPELIRCEKSNSNLYPGVDNDYKICVSTDLTAKAHALHRQNQKSTKVHALA